MYYVADDPGIPLGEWDDPLAGLSRDVGRALLEGEAEQDDPEEDGWAGFPFAQRRVEVVVLEGKAIGTAGMGGAVAARDTVMRKQSRGNVNYHIRQASRNANRDLREVYAEIGRTVGGLLADWTAGKIHINKLRAESVLAWTKAYERAREIGRKASGVERFHPQPEVLSEEETWFRSAVREEMRYWNLFLEEMLSARRGRRFDEGRMWERMEAYTKALRFMYEAARVQALPDSVLFYWMGPKPVRAQRGHICRGCTWMMEHSPFPKDLLPAVPRDGCVADPNALVTTKRGPVPIADVVVGDEVFTHKRRWRRVVRTFVHMARKDHRYAAIKTLHGMLVVTDDHKVYTSSGWVEAKEAAQLGLCVVRCFSQGQEPFGEAAMPGMRQYISAQSEKGAPSEVLFYDVQERGLSKTPSLVLYSMRERVQAQSFGVGEGLKIGKVVLLPQVLRPGSALYDIGVDGDRSFIVDGVVIHNSTSCLTNCRHRLVVRVADPIDVSRRRRQLSSRPTMIRQLRERKNRDHGTWRQSRAREVARTLARRVSNPFAGTSLPTNPTMYRGIPRPDERRPMSEGKRAVTEAEVFGPIPIEHRLRRVEEDVYTNMQMKHLDLIYVARQLESQLRGGSVNRRAVQPILDRLVGALEATVMASQGHSDAQRFSRTMDAAINRLWQVVSETSLAESDAGLVLGAVAGVF